MAKPCAPSRRSWPPSTSKASASALAPSLRAATPVQAFPKHQFCSFPAERWPDICDDHWAVCHHPWAPRTTTTTTPAHSLSATPPKWKASPCPIACLRLVKPPKRWWRPPVLWFAAMPATSPPPQCRCSAGAVTAMAPAPSWWPLCASAATPPARWWAIAWWTPGAQARGSSPTPWPPSTSKKTRRRRPTKVGNPKAPGGRQMQRCPRWAPTVPPFCPSPAAWGVP